MVYGTADGRLMGATNHCEKHSLWTFNGQGCPDCAALPCSDCAEMTDFCPEHQPVVLIESDSRPCGGTWGAKPCPETLGPTDLVNGKITCWRCGWRA